MRASDTPAKMTKTNVWGAVPANLEFGVTNYAGVLGPHNNGNACIVSTATSPCLPDCHNFSLYGKFECSGTFWRHNLTAPVKLRSFTDGTSNTIVVGEVLPDYDDFKVWALGNGAYSFTCPPLNYFPDVYDPWDWYKMNGFRSRHARGASFVCGDGHVAFINDTINLNTYRALSTRAGGELVSIP
jgi:hypothetical protein